MKLILMKKFLALIPGAFALALAASAPAQTLLNDNFENGLGNWSNVGSGYITSDPLNSSNHVLAFSQLGSGGDIFSNDLTFQANTIYRLSCDYLGGLAPGGVGGFLGVDSPGEIWAIGDAGYSTPISVTNDATWHHYSFEWTPGATTGNVKAEQFVGTPGAIPGNIYFDNISVQAVPEPAPCLALAGGVGILALRRRKK